MRSEKFYLFERERVFYPQETAGNNFLNTHSDIRGGGLGVRSETVETQARNQSRRKSTETRRLCTPWQTSSINWCVVWVIFIRLPAYDNYKSFLLFRPALENQWKYLACLLAYVLIDVFFWCVSCILVGWRRFALFSAPTPQTQITKITSPLCPHQRFSPTDILHAFKSTHAPEICVVDPDYLTKGTSKEVLLTEGNFKEV